jgi:prepilin-type N-terminal cleavage/methylation domain-containing protein
MLKNNQKGFTLLEVVMVMGLMGFMSMLYIEHTKDKAERIVGQEVGVELHEFHNATRRFATLNVIDPDLHNNGITNKGGTQWLKSADTCSDGTANYEYLSCMFDNKNRHGGLEYETSIDGSLGSDKLKIKTIVDVKRVINGETTTVFSEDILGLSALVASGGGTSNGVSVSGSGNTSSDPAISGTTSMIIYCPNSLSSSFLHEECTSIGSNTKEGGLIVMITESISGTDTWLRQDGSNDMHNNLGFDSDQPEFREIVGASSIYNLSGEVLKIGNSGAFSSGSGWAPMVGDGVVIDTDAYFTGFFNVKGDTEIEGLVDIAGDLITEGNVYIEESLVVQDNVDIWGDQYVLGNTVHGGSVEVIGSVIADTLTASSYVKAQDLFAEGSVYAEQAISSPVVRATDGLFSEADLSVAGNSLISGNSYIEENLIAEGNIFTSKDLIAQNGSSYLNNVFADVIYDTDGDFMIDPSGVSRMNIMRADRISPSSSALGDQGKLQLNSNNILFASEVDGCDTASAECATSLEGFWDIDNLWVKIKNSSGTEEWVLLLDWISEIHTNASNAEANADSIGDATNTAPVAEPNEPVVECISGYGGIWYKGDWREGQYCP